MSDSRIAMSSLGVKSVGDTSGIGMCRESSRAFSWDISVVSSRGSFQVDGFDGGPEVLNFEFIIRAKFLSHLEPLPMLCPI